MRAISQVLFIDFVLCVAFAITLLSAFVQVRGLPAMLRLRLRTPSGSGGERADGAASIARSRAFASGLLTVALATIAVERAGSGVLVWMWLAAASGMAIAYADTRLGYTASLRRARRGEAGSWSALSIIPGRTGLWLQYAHVLAAAGTLLFVGAAFHGQQLASLPLAGPASSAGPLIAGLVICAVVSGLVFRRSPIVLAMYRLTPATALLLAATLAGLISMSETGVVQLLSECISAAGGARVLFGGGLFEASDAEIRALIYGVGTVWMASIAMAGHDDDTNDRAGSSDTTRTRAAETRSHLAACRAMLAPAWVGWVLAPLTVLALLATEASVREPIDAPQLRSANLDGEQAARFVALERPHTTGFKPSLHGQSMILPKDSPLQADHSYPMVFRASPRGHMVGQLTKKGNGILVPPWEMASNVDTVIFRDADPRRSEQAGHDLHIPVQRTLLGLEDAPFGYVYTPVDPKVDLRKLAATRSGPFIVVDDYHFDGVVLLTHSLSKELGLHLAMYDYASLRPDEVVPGLRPSLQDIIGRLGFRGPYFDDRSGAAGERPPFALAAKMDASFALGDRLQLILEAPDRGLQLGRVRHSGGVDAPPWRFLLGVRELIYPHLSDPALDQNFAVIPTFEDGGLRFRSSDPSQNLREYLTHSDFGPPRLRVPDSTFDVEVRSAVRLPSRVQSSLESGDSGHFALVPLDTVAEPNGRYGQLYDPHPAELIQAGMRGPYLQRSGAGAGVYALFDQGSAGLSKGLLAIALACLVFMGWAAMLSWIEYGGALCARVLGPGARPGFALVFVITAAWSILGAAPAEWADGERSFEFGLRIVALALVIQCSGLALALSDLLPRHLRARLGGRE